MLNEEKGLPLAQQTEIGLLLDYLHGLLVKTNPPEPVSLPKNITDLPKFQDACAQILALREMSMMLRRGKLDHAVPGRGFVLSNLKAVQSNLQHLTWQAKRIAEGDFTQNANLLGEFSETFNEMTQSLIETTTQLVNLANIDTLTKIPNRLALSRFLSTCFEASVKDDTEMCVLMLDIDRFKSVNDTYGHGIGDEVLIEVARRIQTQTRQEDFFARYGGEEFIIVLPGTGTFVAGKVCERILEHVRKTPIACTGDIQVSLTLSIGFSQRLPEDTSYEQIIARSDLALYAAKNSGRNCYRMYEVEPPEM